MKSIYIVCVFLFIVAFQTMGQEATTSPSPPRDTIAIQNLNEIVVSALRINIPLRQIPAAISVVSGTQVNAMSKTISPDEALRRVPGHRGLYRWHFYQYPGRICPRPVRCGLGNREKCRGR